MEYDKNNKKRLVLDYHNKEINNYILDKNKFSLKNFKLEMNGKDKNECAEYLLNSKLEGFKYYGNKNKCYLFNTNNFNKPLDKDLIKKYNIINKKKYKYLKDYDIYKDQKDINNYFKEVNNYNFNIEGNINEENVQNLDECLEYCHNNDKCKNVLYMKEKDKCKFYGTKDFLNNEVGIEYDTYTKKKLKDYDIKIENNKSIHKKNNDEDKFTYTSCINNKNYNNIEEMYKDYNKICKKELGNEYIFENKDDNQNVIDCDLNNKKIRCDLDLTNKKIIENYDNDTNLLSKSIFNEDNTLNLFTYILISIIIISFLFIFFYYIIKN